MNRTPNIDDELIIEIVKGMTMFAFQRGNWQKPIEPHELIEYTTAIKTLLANKIKEAELVGAVNALYQLKADRVAHTMGNHPKDWTPEIDFIDHHIAQLTNQYKGDDNE